MNTPTNPSQEVTKQSKKKNQNFKSWSDLCKTYKRNLIKNWAINVDFRKGKTFPSSPDSDQISVNLDWPLTKTKIASLFSQVPRVCVDHHPDSQSAGPWLGKYSNKLNDTIRVGGIESCMKECLPDSVNAAGFGAAIASFEALTEDKEVPKMDMGTLPPQVAAQALQTGMLNGQPLEMTMVPQKVDTRYLIQRISPTDFLWPLNFMGSDFNKAPWIGRSGRITWAEAVQRYGLTEDDKEKVVGEDRRTDEILTPDTERDAAANPDENVSFDEIFYRESCYNPDAKSFSTIHHLVFINGKTDPVVDEPWKGQQATPDGKVLGSLKYPIQVLTLAYITDEAIPPSDSAIGRPQVLELNKSRRQMILQRERNLPVRWFDVNRLDPSLAHSLMRGVWQNFIPVQGDGGRVIGEVAKSGHPVEDFTFDQIAKRDLNESWSIGPNQMGSGDNVETKGESNEIANNFQTRVGQERAEVASFFVNLAEVVGGLLCLYEPAESFGEGFDPSFSKSLGFSILADSTVLVDSQQRLSHLNQFMNTYAKSGFVQIEPVLKEIATLVGLDPDVVIKAPEPQSPPPPNISFRMSGAVDMMNPLCLATFLAEGKPPTADLIEQAKALIQSAVTMPLPPPPPQVGPDGMPLPPGAPGMPPPPGGPAGPPPPGGPPPVPVGDAHPNMTVLPKITKRSDDPGAGGKEPI